MLKKVKSNKSNLFSYINRWLVSGLLTGLTCLILLPIGAYRSGSPVATVQYKLEQLIEELNDQHRAVEAQAKDSIANPFSSFTTAKLFPYFIYKNDQPWFWSDFYIGPFRETLRSQSFQYHQSIQGSFISKTTYFKNSRGAKLSLSTLLPLSGYKAESGSGKFFAPSVVAVSATAGPNLLPIKIAGNQPLIYVQLSTDQHLGNDWLYRLSAWLSIIALVLVGVGLLKLSIGKRKLTANSALTLIIFVLVRIVYIQFNLPSLIYPLEIFNPRYFASGWLNPSLADFVLNMLWYGGIWYILSRLIFSYSIVRWAKRQKITFQWAVVGSVLAGFILLNILLTRTLFRHVQFPLDITEDINLQLPRLVAYLVFFSSAAILYFQLLPLYRYLARLLLPRRGLAILLVLLLGWIVVFMLVASWGWVVVIIALAWVYVRRSPLVLSGSKLPRGSRALPVFGEMLGVALLAAAAGGVIALDQFLVSKKAAQEQLATQILSEQDVVGEYLLSEAGNRISQDLYIINRFLSPLFTLDGMAPKIRRMYLSRYFDKYTLDVNFFSLDGLPLRNSQLLTYSGLASEAAKQGKETEYFGLYRLENASASWQYHYRYFIPVEFKGNKLGYVVLNLQLRQIGGDALYPELLLSNQTPQLDASRYSFAIYRGDSLQFTNGIFNYSEEFGKANLGKPQLFKSGVQAQDYLHFGVKGERRVVVVSAKARGPLQFYANFAFLLLFLLLMVSVYYLAYILTQRASVRYLSLTTKVQLYLNAAILIPLLVITFSTLSFLNRTYRNQTEATYFAKAERISRGIAETLQQYQAGIANAEQLNTLVEDMARFADADIHLFDTSGHLLASNQPTLFQKYLSPYVNPLAMAGLVEHNNRQIITTEEINNLEYKAAYVSIKKPASGELIGLVSVPFFDAGYRLQEQLSSIFSNFVGVFATLFFIFLILLQLLSRGLTDPLRYIAERLRLTSLSGRNEPLEWPANDEIGRLVHEYNQMLRNLQVSKEALSQSEKESAWREMAKQVAHEIKNPLTPMRLSLQHLNRRLESSLEGHQRDKVNQSFQSLLEQVDTLSDIATTFSAFAKMPIPRLERFDVASMVKRVVSLFDNSSQTIVKAQVPDNEVWIEGDEQLMQRTLNNLIINGQQAVPESRMAQISVILEAEPNSVRIIVTDNGNGIPEPIRSKVFVPNFSTKNSGSGLGLAIAKRGVEHAGGKIWYETEIEKGTRFYIDLPRTS